MIRPSTTCSLTASVTLEIRVGETLSPPPPIARLVHSPYASILAPKLPQLPPSSVDRRITPGPLGFYIHFRSWLKPRLVILTTPHLGYLPIVSLSIDESVPPCSLPRLGSSYPAMFHSRLERRSDWTRCRRQNLGGRVCPSVCRFSGI